MSLELHVGAPTSGSILTQVEFCQFAESIGFSGVGIADHLEHGHDAYITIAKALEVTTAIELYTSVTNPVTRHPFTLACLANSLNELGPGRFKLGIGTGDSSVANIGVRPATVARFREVLAEIRQLLSGGSVVFGTNPDAHIENPVNPPPSILVTGSGPKALKTAGEFGDEAMILAGIPKNLRARAFSHIENGAKSAAKSLDNYKVSHVLSVSIDPDPQEARNRVWPAVFFWVSTGFFNDPIAEMGIELPKLEKPEGVSEELKTVLCDTFTINGTESQVLNRFHELKDEGLERAYVLAFGGGDSRENMMKLLAKDLLN